LGVLGTQETFCIVIAGLLERDSFDLFLPEFDKPWVIHLRPRSVVPIPDGIGRDRPGFGEENPIGILPRIIIIFAFGYSQPGRFPRANPVNPLHSTGKNKIVSHPVERIPINRGARDHDAT
jgi:hypothetical protein